CMQALEFLPFTF
nr:immunoglobulin light chain junction region [Macaca mulatta]